MISTTKLTRVVIPAGILALALGGCAVVPPSGPTIVALPQHGEPLDQFQRDDYSCRDYAFHANNATGAAQSATTNSVNTAALGTLGWRKRRAVFRGRPAGTIQRGLRSVHDLKGQHDLAAADAGLCATADVLRAAATAADVLRALSGLLSGLVLPAVSMELAERDTLAGQATDPSGMQPASRSLRSRAHAGSNGRPRPGCDCRAVQAAREPDLRYGLASRET